MKTLNKENIKNELLNKLYNMLLEQTMHNIMVHGYGFCAHCGELRKRCGCEYFVEGEVCKCNNLKDI
jgi:hypothetical protein